MEDKVKEEGGEKIISSININNQQVEREIENFNYISNNQLIIEPDEINFKISEKKINNGNNIMKDSQSNSTKLPIEHLEFIDNLENLYFLFVNPKSGSEEGEVFFKILEKNNCSKFSKEYKVISSLDEKSDNSKNAYVYLFNIRENEEKIKGYNMILDYISFLRKEDSKIKVLVGGGDGTVLSIIEELNDFGVNINKCIFGHVPLGTGNDLANALGFGCTKKYLKL